MGEKVIRKIVITGGPCAGKSTAAEYIRQYFENEGYCVLVMAETATELIKSGIAPWTLESRCDYQRCQLEMQTAKELVFSISAEKIKGCDKILIVCDRGIMDSKAYMGEEAFNNAITELNMTETDVLNRYDAVFHLKSAANGAKEFYTLENNSARIETPEEAAKLDLKFTEVWKKHPYFQIVECEKNIEEKMNSLIEKICKFLNNV